MEYYMLFANVTKAIFDKIATTFLLQLSHAWFHLAHNLAQYVVLLIWLQYAFCKRYQNFKESISISIEST